VNTNPVQYTGRENDATGLHYYRARYYNATLGRFISEDPIGFLGGQANLYAYVGDDPIDFIDPLGLKRYDPKACQTKVLNAVNSQFGINLTDDNILPTSSLLPQQGGQVNVDIGINSGLSPAQFNVIQPGRYAPPGVLGFLTGYGPSLHVVAEPTPLDPTALVFSNSNIGGEYSVSFTAHIDSAWANNPIGALSHLIVDVLGHKSRNPCP